MSISIIGMGMGGSGTLTVDAQKVISEANVVIGAERLLQSLPENISSSCFAAVLLDDILNIICQHDQKKICVLMSGDVGFYSGAKKLVEALDGQNISVISGISSVQYFASKLKRPWGDWKLVSAHGKTCDIICPVRDNAETFFLTGGQLTVQSICQQLLNAGFGDCLVTIGENLGSHEEQIKSSTAEVLSQSGTEKLAVMLVDNPTPRRLVSCGFADNTFIRGNIPMTKSEVRSVILSKLQLRDNDIIYDIGAGTGSVSVEAALLAKNGHVYAFERESEGCRLIKDNAMKFGISNLTQIEGEAPATFSGIPSPNAAFIGGSGGNLLEILDHLLRHNPSVRLVISAVTLETLAEATAAFSRLPVNDVEIVQISVSRAKLLGEYHMLTAQNPIFIISGVGRDGF